MDRTLTYPGQVPRALDNLLLGRFALTGLAKLSEAVLGTSTVVPQGAFTVTPATGLNINVGAGQIYQLESIEPITQSALGVDGHQVLKQGIALDAQTLTLAPPSTVGYAQNFLIQVAYQDVPSGQVVLSFQNPTPVLDPSTGAYKYVTYPGPGGNGQQSTTILQGGVSVSAKPGVAATSGSQSTPAPDTGFVGLYVVTLAYGASSISNGNISAYASAPFLPVTLPGVPVAVQANTWSYAVASGTNALTASLTPNPPALVDGLTISLYCPNTNTGAATLALNGYPAAPIVRRDGTSVQAGDIFAGGILRLSYRAGVWGFVTTTKSEMTAISVSIIQARRIAGSTPYRYASPGNYTLAVPAGTIFSIAECRGGGGGGGGANGTNAAGSGGGGGGNAAKVCQAITDTVLAITVGAGGSPGSAGGGNAGSGGTSLVSVQSGTVQGTNGTTFTAGQTLCAATGGTGGYGGVGGNQGTQQGLGGVASGGDLNDNGDSGGYPPQVGTYSFGGSGGASPGSGGRPDNNYAAAGNSSSAAGTGGNGSSANAIGGYGTPGRVTIYQ